MSESKNNFWGESSSDSNNSQKIKATKNPNHKFDLKCFFTFLFLILALGIGITLNNNSNDNSQTKIIGLVDIDNSDLNINWDRLSSFNIELSENITITESGIYHITGSLLDGSITVNSGEKGKVKLILDNVTIKNSSGPAINCISGDELVIESVGANVLRDGSKYSDDLDEDINGVIYSKADLTFQGDGTLDVTSSYQDAIVGKDDVKFNGGTYNITAADDGIRGKDSVYIVDGNFNITSKADAIKSTNESDTGKGFVLIEGGNVKISAGDDGIHGIRVLAVQGGDINIVKSYEGFEAQKIIINDGNISVIASDDGINAGGGPSSSSDNRNPFEADENCELIINGGNININSYGDGVDSNGYVHINGGTVIVDGPTNNGNSALDSGAGIIMNGGEVIAIGSSGMIDTPSSDSKMFNASIYFSTYQKAGTKFEIKNSSGEVIISHTSAKTFSHAAIGSEKFVFGETYTIYINDEEYQDFLIDNTTTMVGGRNSNTNMSPRRR